MLSITYDEFTIYLYRKLGLAKTHCEKVVYNRAYGFFQDKDITEGSCAQFLDEIDQGISPFTYNNYLKTFKKLLNAQGIYYIDSYKQKKCETPYIPILDEEEIIRFLKVCYKNNYRRAVAVEVFCRTGMRARELADLQWSDYHDEIIFIAKSKTRRSREVVITKDLQEKIEKLRGNHYEYVFGFNNQGKLSVWRLNEFIKDMLVKAAINKKITNHKLRHSFATLMAEKGVSHFVIKDFLGHQRITTTQLYVHTSRNSQRDAAKKVSLKQYKPKHKEIVNEIMQKIVFVDDLNLLQSIRYLLNGS